MYEEQTRKTKKFLKKIREKSLSNLAWVDTKRKVLGHQREVANAEYELYKIDPKGKKGKTEKDNENAPQ